MPCTDPSPTLAELAPEPPAASLDTDTPTEGAPVTPTPTWVCSSSELDADAPSDPRTHETDGPDARHDQPSPWDPVKVKPDGRVMLARVFTAGSGPALLTDTDTNALRLATTGPRGEPATLNAARLGVGTPVVVGSGGAAVMGAGAVVTTDDNGAVDVVVPAPVVVVAATVVVVVPATVVVVPGRVVVVVAARVVDVALATVVVMRASVVLDAAVVVTTMLVSATMVVGLSPPVRAATATATATPAATTPPPTAACWPRGRPRNSSSRPLPAPAAARWCRYVAAGTPSSTGGSALRSVPETSRSSTSTALHGTHPSRCSSTLARSRLDSESRT